MASVDNTTDDVPLVPLSLIDEMERCLGLVEDDSKKGDLIMAADGEWLLAQAKQAVGNWKKFITSPRYYPLTLPQKHLSVHVIPLPPRPSSQNSSRTNSQIAGGEIEPHGELGTLEQAWDWIRRHADVRSTCDRGLHYINI